MYFAVHRNNIWPLKNIIKGATVETVLPPGKCRTYMAIQRDLVETNNKVKNNVGN